MTVQPMKRKADHVNATPQNLVVKRQKVSEESHETANQSTQTVAQEVFARAASGCAASPDFCMPALSSPPFPPPQTSIQDLWNSLLKPIRSSRDKIELILKILNHPDYANSSKAQKLKLFWGIDSISKEKNMLDVLEKLLLDWPSVFVENNALMGKFTDHLITLWNTYHYGSPETDKKIRKIFTETLLPAVPNDSLIILYKSGRENSSFRLNLFMLGDPTTFDRTPLENFEEIILDSLHIELEKFIEIVEKKPISIEKLRKLFLKLCLDSRKEPYRSYMLIKLPHLFTEDFILKIIENLYPDEYRLSLFFQEIGLDVEKLPAPFLRVLLEVLYIKPPPDGTKKNKEMYRSCVPRETQLKIFDLLKRKAPELNKPLLEIAHTLSHPTGRAMIEPALLPFLEDASKREAMGLFALGTLPTTPPGTTPLQRLFENSLFERRLLRCIGDYLWAPKNTSTAPTT